MYLKLAAALLGVFGVAWLGRAALGPAQITNSAAADSIQLVPAKLGAAPQIRRWRNLRPGHGNLVESGALYAAGAFGAAPVLLDFFRGDNAPHNGIGCFLDQGESLTNERVMTLSTRTSPQIFDVGVVETPSLVRVIAATECSSNGCTAELLPFLGHYWMQWRWSNFVDDHIHGVVPAAVILTQKTDARQAPMVIAQLRGELVRAVAQIDLVPAQRLAAAQGG